MLPLSSPLPFLESGDVLLSRAVSSQVPSACGGLTSVFGMGTGGSLQLLSPEILFRFGSKLRLLPHLQNRTGFDRESFTTFFVFSFFRTAFSHNGWRLDQALDLLVSPSSIRYRTSTDDLSTSSSLRGLTNFCCGSLILQGGFTLRCLQRLSRPHFASLLCPWQNNSFTRGASTPVLSY